MPPEVTIRMVQVRKPDLDDVTIQIARRMLSTPPKPHEEMKIGKHRTKSKQHPPRKTKMDRKSG